MTVPQIIDLLTRQQADEIKVIVGGIVPSADRQKLLDRGVLEVFGPGQDTRTIIEFLERH